MRSKPYYEINVIDEENISLTGEFIKYLNDNNWDGNMKYIPRILSVFVINKHEFELYNNETKQLIKLMFSNILNDLDINIYGNHKEVTIISFGDRIMKLSNGNEIKLKWREHE